MTTFEQTLMQSLLVEDFATAFSQAIVDAQLIVAALVVALIVAGALLSLLAGPSESPTRFAH
jgi:hypothetical protein